MCPNKCMCIFELGNRSRSFINNKIKLVSFHEIPSINSYDNIEMKIIVAVAYYSFLFENPRTYNMQCSTIFAGIREKPKTKTATTINLRKRSHDCYKSFIKVNIFSVSYTSMVHVYIMTRIDIT